MAVRVHTFTDDHKYLALKREIAMRRRVYSGLVDTGRMTEAQSEAGIAVMEAIADDYAPPDLFDHGDGA